MNIIRGFFRLSIVAVFVSTVVVGHLVVKAYSDAWDLHTESAKNYEKTMSQYRCSAAVPWPTIEAARNQYGHVDLKLIGCTSFSYTVNYDDVVTAKTDGAEKAARLWKPLPEPDVIWYLKDFAWSAAFLGIVIFLSVTLFGFAVIFSRAALVWIRKGFAT